MEKPYVSNDLYVQYTKNNKKLNLMILRLNIISYILFSIYAITPYFTYNQSNILLGVILGLWGGSFILIVLYRLYHYMSTNVNIPLIILFFLWLPYVFILRIVGFSTAEWGNFFVYALFWFSYMVFYFYDELININMKKNIIISIIVMYIFNLANNIYILIKHPGANKLVNFYNEYRELNIGGTNFAFEAALCSLICLFLLLNRWEYKKNILKIFFTLNLIYLFVFSAKTTTIILFTCASVFMILNNKLNSLSNRAKGKIYAMFISILGFILLITPNIFRFLGNIISSVDIKMRFLSMASFLENFYMGNIVVDDYMLRVDLALLSIDSFISSPIFGIGKHIANQQMYGLNAVYTIGIGSHSELIDHLAVYGLIGVFVYIVLFKKYFNSLSKKSISNSNLSSYKVILYFVLVYSICNNSFSMACGVILFVFLPFAIDVVNKEKI